MKKIYLFLLGTACAFSAQASSPTIPGPAKAARVQMVDDLGVTLVSGPVSGCALPSNQNITIRIRNFGANSQSNVPVSYTINGGTPVTAVFAGPIAAGASAMYTFPTAADLSAAGTYTIAASTNLAGDVNAANNTKTITVTSGTPPFPTVPDVARCGPGSVVLSATTVANGVAAFYTAATGGNPVIIENEYQTPNITGNTEYYVSTRLYGEAGSVGPANGAAVGAGGIGGPFNNEMIFNALVPLRIDSVTVTSGGAGTYLVVLRSALSSQPGSVGLDSALFTVPAAGTFRVPLGIEVPAAGNGYTLAVVNSSTGAGGLFRNTAGATFPYTLPGVISITGANFGTDPFTSPRFYNLYNWGVSVQGCESPRIPVDITINQLPNAAFTFTNPSGGTFNFTGPTVAGATYNYDFGDTNTSSQQSPTHTFAAPGNYNVTLQVIANGCTATTTQTVTFLPSTDAGVTSINSPLSGCGLTATEQVCVTVSNLGATVLTNVPVSYSIQGGPVVNDVVAGPIAPGATSTFCFSTPANLSTPGSYTIMAATALSGDGNNSNDSSSTMVTVLAQPGTPTASDVTTCGAGPVTLSASTSSGTVSWFTSATGGTPVGTGNTFTTPSLSSNTTYYVGSSNYISSGANTVQLGTVGPLNGAAVGAGAIGGPFTNEMIFNTQIPLRIDSITVTTDNSGTYTVGIRNALSTLPGSTVLDSVTFSVPAAGTHRVYLGLEVPIPGNGYTLGLLSSTVGSGGLFRNTAGATYPYVNPGVISITGANFGTDPFTSPRFYNFYNWSVSASVCESSRVPVNITIGQQPAAPTANGGSRCGAGTVELNATSSSGTLLWYTSATGGSAVGSGTTFTTPSITTTTTYYVAASNMLSSGPNTVQLGTVGPLNGTAVGAGAIGGPFTNEMLFNTQVPLRIDSVTMTTDAAGTYTIGWRNMLSTLAGSMVMDSVTVSVPGAGTHRVYLGLEIPTPGTGYTLGLLSATTGSGGLFRNTAGATYPYVNPGVISITGANFGTDPFTSPRFYNFYNWSVSASVCESPRVPVVATINAAPNAAFTFTSTGSTYTFNATSATGTYSWTFAGGSPATSTAQNPTVTFAAPGAHAVTLMVDNGTCTASTTQTITITGRAEELSNALKMYPNPTKGEVHIEVGQSGMDNVEVYNALGQLVHQQHLSGQQQTTLMLNHLAEGAYTVRVTGNGTLLVKQLLLQK